MPNFRTIESYFLPLWKKEDELVKYERDHIFHPEVIIHSSQQILPITSHATKLEDNVQLLHCLKHTLRVLDEQQQPRDEILLPLGLNTLVNLTSLYDNEHPIHATGDFLFSYGNFLLGLVTRKEELQFKIANELKYVINELIVTNEKLLQKLVENIWATFENRSIVYADLFNDIIEVSQHIIEGKVCQWITEVLEFNAHFENVNTKYIAVLSSQCKNLFKIVMNILHHFAALSGGDKRLQSFIMKYISEVNKNCELNSKSILSLYPRNFTHMISLIQIPPFLFLHEGQRKILKEIYDNFRVCQKQTLMFLLHYPQWLYLFYNLLNEMSNVL